MNGSNFNLINNKVYGNSGNLNVLSRIPDHAISILDIGCGRGDNARILKEKGKVIDGISISNEEIIQARPFLDNAIIKDVTNGLPFNLIKQEYEIIICSHVLEHIAYPDQLLSDIKLLMSKESLFIVALPNIMHYSSRIKLCKGDFNYQSMGLWDYTHLRWYTYSTARILLEKAGYEIIEINVTGDLPFNRLFKKILSYRIRQKLFNYLKKISPGLFGYEIILVLKLK